jgi:hypothetical protein
MDADTGAGNTGGSVIMPEAGPPPGGEGGEGGSSGAPPVSTLLWSATHEAGDLSEWDGFYTSSDDPVASDARAHGGQYSLAFTIDTADRNTHVLRVYQPTVYQPAYYSAWFFLEEDHVPVEWWSIFIFLSANDLSDPGALEAVWDLNLRHEDDGLLYPYVYDHLKEQNTDLGTVPVPVGQWVHLEFYFAYAPPDSGELRLWVNGEFAVEALGLGEASAPYLAFSLGNGSNGLTPDVSTIYVDDAAISTERLGPF